MQIDHRPSRSRPDPIPASSPHRMPQRPPSRRRSVERPTFSGTGRIHRQPRSFQPLSQGNAGAGLVPQFQNTLVIGRPPVILDPIQPAVDVQRIQNQWALCVGCELWIPCTIVTDWTRFYLAIGKISFRLHSGVCRNLEIGSRCRKQAPVIVYEHVPVGREPGTHGLCGGMPPLR